MLEWALEPLHYAYMRNAIGVSALVGAACAFLSAFVVLKGWSLMGDALSHSLMPGVAAAYALGSPLRRRRLRYGPAGGANHGADAAPHPPA